MKIDNRCILLWNHRVNFHFPLLWINNYKNAKIRCCGVSFGPRVISYKANALISPQLGDNMESYSFMGTLLETIKGPFRGWSLLALLDFRQMHVIISSCNLVLACESFELLSLFASASTSRCVLFSFRSILAPRKILLINCLCWTWFGELSVNTTIKTRHCLPVFSLH